MEYGFIVIKKNDYNNLFFIHNVNDKNITLIPSSEPATQIIDTQDNYTIVYKPKLRGVCELNNLHLNNNVLFTYKDTEREGKIIKKKKDLIHVQFYKEPNKPIEVFDFDYKGIPPTLLHIKKITIETEKDRQLNQLNSNYVKESIESIESIDNEYYYSIEQQVNVLLEDINKNVDLNNKSQQKIRDKIILHYIELNKKYYTHENNYLYKKISDKPLYNKIIKGESIFDFYSDNIKIFLYEDDSLIPNDLDLNYIKVLFNDAYDFNAFFFYEVDQFSLDTNNNPIETNSKIMQINDANIDNLSIENSKYKSTYKRDNETNVLLEHANNEEGDWNMYDSNLYFIKTNKEFIIDGIVIPSIRKLKNYIKQSNMNQLIYKINTPHYVKETYVIGNPYEECLFTEKNQIIKKNKVGEKDVKKEFYTFLNSILPSIRSFIKCLNLKCYTMYDYIKQISIFDIYELSKKDFEYINRVVQKNILDYKKITNQMLIEPNVYVTNSFLLTSLLDSIGENNYYKDSFYSSSELFQFSLYENHTLLLFDNIKSNLTHKLDRKSDITKEIIDELNMGMNKDSTLSYDKIYSTINELKLDIKPIVKDLITNTQPITNVSYLKSSTQVWNKINKSIFKSMEEFELELKKYIVHYEPTSKLEPYKKMIKEWAKNNMITNGMLAYVLETNQTFVYENERWILNVEANLVKGSKENNAYVNKRINEIVKEESTKELNMKQEYNDRTYYETKSKYINSFNKSIFLKYNQIKRVYSQLYQSNGYKPSPYQYIFDKVLEIENEEEKKKNIKIFCELYTIEGIDPYWLYCIESGTKLVPTFLKTLAYSNNYNETIQQICFNQGTQQDEYWVDKYSGYTIKKINFNEEEGFTSDGFKVVSREVIKESSGMVTEIEKNIETILNAIGISIEHIKPIYIEYTKLSKLLSKNSLLIYVVIFIYIQCFVDTSEIKKSFFSCKTSFDGYPLSKQESETAGIEYMICVYKSLTNKKISKKTTEIDISNFIKLIKNCLKNSSKLSHNLSIGKTPKIETKISNTWLLFLPRLNKLNLTKIHNEYYKNFYFQHEMNEWIQKIEPQIQLSNGSYKTINNYDKSNIEMISSYQQRLKHKVANLYYYNQITKNPNKFKLSKPTYSLKKIDRILNPNYNDLISDDELKEKYPEINDELMKEVFNTLHTKHQLYENNKNKKEIVKSSIHESNIKTYKSFIDKYLNEHIELKLNKLFMKLKVVSKKRVNIVTSKDEHDKMEHTILFNLLNDIILQSMMKETTTYTSPTLRKYFQGLLKSSDKVKLLNIIENTYKFTNKDEKIEESIIQNMKLFLDFNLKDKIIIYKYYLCTIYENSSKEQRATYEKLIETLTKTLVIKVDIIKKNNEQAKYKEKKEITDKFKEMNDDNRNVELLLKQSKLGDWSIGLSTAIYKYNAKSEDKKNENNEEGDFDVIEENTEYEEYMDEEE